ncbi:glycosyltransferase [Rhodohalobacter sp. SW132]|uniref:glycosyltransferase n=1 Tax=Rhodohalobacter sp. SW132 TaxID=2293433 RepID=UPI000E265CE7|nr:glycosyltransferase family 2 protein [Rhodohalobacter sp. SW132]REL38443.1 glycosyltransferase [Rhodohalobacter sp. SW132]
MKFSIVTPAYNEEDRIEKCINSVRRQIFDDFEMIIIDDGSVDGTSDKVKKFTSIDERIKLIQLSENVGLTAAKNVALDQVKGDYLVFVDADDWILPNMLSDLAEQLNNYVDIDMFRLKGRKVFSRDEDPAPDPDYEISLSTPVDLIRENKMSGYMHNLVVKNSIVQSNHIRFTPGRVVLEDQEFTMKCMVYSSNILYYTKKNYLYFQRPGSLSNNVKTEQIPDIIECATNVYECAQNRFTGDKLHSFRDYTIIKCNQFLKAVLRDRDFPPEQVKAYMNTFFNKVNLPFHIRAMQSLKLIPVQVAKRVGF